MPAGGVPPEFHYVDLSEGQPFGWKFIWSKIVTLRSPGSRSETAGPARLVGHHALTKIKAGECEGKRGLPTLSWIARNACRVGMQRARRHALSRPSPVPIVPTGRRGHDGNEEKRSEHQTGSLRAAEGNTVAHFLSEFGSHRHCSRWLKLACTGLYPGDRHARRQGMVRRMTSARSSVCRISLPPTPTGRLRRRSQPGSRVPCMHSALRQVRMDERDYLPALQHSLQD